jgi:hypothetical protein
MSSELNFQQTLAKVLLVKNNFNINLYFNFQAMIQKPFVRRKCQQLIKFWRIFCSKIDEKIDKIIK